MESQLEVNSPPQCVYCGQPIDAVAGGLPVCAACLPALTHRPLPRWIQIAAAIIGIVLLLALLQFPSSLTAGIAFERGRRAEAARDYKLAEQQYAIVADRFPSSTLAIARLGIASYHAGDFLTAMKSFATLEGRETSESLASEVNVAIDDMKRRLGESINGGQQP